ncbi:hypothetical protein CN233_17825 [Sinorhizobium meliloti]|uniref:Uncharacterized protein n=1 Tax=Rhizobium meliloti TaxID=382 RepID=A0A6A7ZX59_RHIML|nr:hypothetical protein [Sinorhizobium meliloti]MDW9809095.1 hypothetical protein [Sinorhizobium meliloti]MDW9956639.1 hypothetical protein [Sinorhizobium meliloti]MDX0125347.1 hypothetical protein [Sinorhizobium meliloti]MDX0135991.1 hypothetical protein [Sinorhizobium meliloti]
MGAPRRQRQLPLDDCLYALQPTIPHLTRSSLHRYLQRQLPCFYATCGLISIINVVTLNHANCVGRTQTASQP